MIDVTVATHHYREIAKKAVVAVTTATVLMSPALAHANAGLAGWMRNFGEQMSVVIGILAVIFGLVGVGFAGFGVISAILAKKNREPLQYQGWYIIGGTLLLILVPFMLMLAATLSGDAGAAQQSLDNMQNIRF